MKWMTAAAVAAVVLASVIEMGAAFKCTLQTGQSDFEDVDCDTYCLIVYYKNYFIPGFVGVDKICSALGCAVLDSAGELDVEATGVLSSEFPADGEVKIYKCNDDVRTEYPDLFEASAPTPCNSFTDYMGDQTCADLPDEYLVATLDKEGNWWLMNMYYVIGAGIGGLALCGCIFCYLKKRTPIDDMQLAYVDAMDYQSNPKTTGLAAKADNYNYDNPEV